MPVLIRAALGSYRFAITTIAIFFTVRYHVQVSGVEEEGGQDGWKESTKDVKRKVRWIRSSSRPLTLVGVHSISFGVALRRCVVVLCSHVPLMYLALPNHDVPDRSEIEIASYVFLDSRF